jgi:hypothetical protein
LRLRDDLGAREGLVRCCFSHCVLLQFSSVVGRPFRVRPPGTSMLLWGICVYDLSSTLRGPGTGSLVVRSA